MFRRSYKVKGEDVNDFMVMQDVAYTLYTSRLLESFIFEMGYSKQKLGALNIDMKSSNKKMTIHKDLMFAQSFFVNLEIYNTAYNNEKFNIISRFFNNRNELCALVTKEIHWINHQDKGEITIPPKKMMSHFSIHKLPYYTC